MGREGGGDWGIQASTQGQLNGGGRGTHTHSKRAAKEGGGGRFFQWQLKEAGGQGRRGVGEGRGGMG